MYKLNKNMFTIALLAGLFCFSFLRLFCFGYFFGVLETSVGLPQAWSLFPSERVDLCSDRDRALAILFFFFCPFPFCPFLLSLLPFLFPSSSSMLLQRTVEKHTECSAQQQSSGNSPADRAQGDGSSTPATALNDSSALVLALSFYSDFFFLSKETHNPCFVKADSPHNSSWNRFYSLYFGRITIKFYLIILAIRKISSVIGLFS